MMRRQSLVAVILMLVLVCFTTPAYTATFNVTVLTDANTNPPPAGSLREAITNANNTAGADIITFNSTLNGTITLAAPLPITDSLTITGISNVKVASANNQPVFAPNAGVNLAISTLSADLTTGGSFITTNGGTLSLQSMTIDAGAGNSFGIQATNSTVALNNVTVRDTNNAAGAGAISVNGGSLTLQNSLIQSNTGTQGAVFVTGNASLNVNNNVRFFGNDTTDATNTAAGLTANTASGTINGASFSNNQDDGLRLDNGTYDVLNVTAGSNGASGIRIGAGGSVDISFSTLYGNATNGVNFSGANYRLDSVIIYNNTGAECNTAANSLLDINIIQDNSCGTNSTLIQADPQVTPQLAGGFTLFYSPSTAAPSPAIDRAAYVSSQLNCTDADGSRVSNDAIGAFRPFNGNVQQCDIGAIEVPTSDAPLGRYTVNPTTINTTEGGAATAVNYSVSPAPVAGVTVTLTLATSANCSLSATQLLFNSATPNQSVNVSAVDDTAREGNHTCEVTGTTTANNGAGYIDGLFNGKIPDKVTVNITDSDVFPEPPLDTNGDGTPDVFDVSAFNAPLAVEGVTRNVVVRLDRPPSATVNFAFTDTAGQCEFPSGNTLAVTAANWNNAPIAVRGIIDPRTGEPDPHQCKLQANVTYTATANTVNNVPLPFITLGPDPAPALRFNRDSISLAEGQTSDGQGLNVTLALQPPQQPTDTEQFTVNLTTNNPTKCLVTPAQVTFTGGSANPVGVNITAVADSTDDATNETCTVTTTNTTSLANAVAAANTSLPVTLLADCTAAPTLRVEYAGQVFPNNAQLVENGPVYELDLKLDRCGTTAQTVVVTETNRTPTQPNPVVNYPDYQCFFSNTSTATGGTGVGTYDANGNLFQNFTLNTANNFTTKVYLRAFNDPYRLNERPADSHNCTVTFALNGVTSTYNLSIIDDDGPGIYIEPPQTGTTLVENSTTTATYKLTFPPTGNVQVQFSYNTAGGTLPNARCVLRRSDGTILADQNTTGTLTLNAATMQQTVTIAAIDNGVRQADSICSYTAVYLSGPPEYTADIGNTDTFVPDISYRITDASSASNQPTATPFGTGVATSSVLQATTVVNTPTPLSRPYLIINEDIDGNIPVRTGPYLGATPLTYIVERNIQRTSGELIPIQYLIFGKSRDESADVVWYYIEVNGRSGWISGRVVNVDLNGDGNFDITPETNAAILAAEISGNTGETTTANTGDNVNLAQWNSIPFRSSIFDEIDGSPELGVTGNVLTTKTIHRRPSRRAAVIGVVEPFTQVSIIGRTRENPYDDWYQVRVNGVVGWIETNAQAEQPSIEVNAEVIRERVPVR